MKKELVVFIWVGIFNTLAMIPNTTWGDILENYPDFQSVLLEHENTQSVGCIEYPNCDPVTMTCCD